jgi:SPP1 gp7 family putative phage head morphogenesis protein
MMMKCNHNAEFHAHANRIDPTQTGQLRKRFEADFKRRFAKLKKAIIDEVAKQDGFGMNALTTNRRFDFPTNQEKVAGFMAWLNQQQDTILFDGTLAMPRYVAAQRAWMDTYIDNAYRRGLRKATVDITRAGGQVSSDYLDAAFLRPVHADRAGIIYTRAYDSLVGITEAMDTQISAILADGIASGFSPVKIASQINDRVDKIGITRARLLARTEVIAAHAEAKLNVYEDANIQGVGLMSEWLTAGDDKVCEECEASAAAGPYEVKSVHGMIPLHPNCRCTWVPYIVSGKGIVLQ